jgi:hypothetical protein
LIVVNLLSGVLDPEYNRTPTACFIRFYLPLKFKRMALDISDADVLTRFDMLVENGIIYYGPTNAIPLLDENFRVSLLYLYKVETYHRFLPM